MRFSLHRIPRESKVAAVVLGAALVQVGVLAALGLKSTADRREAFEAELAERARPVLVKVAAEAAARVAETERRIGEELAADPAAPAFGRVLRVLETGTARMFESAFLVDAEGRVTECHLPPFDVPAAGPRDEAARAALAKIQAIETSDPAGAVAAARALSDMLSAKPACDVVAAALTLQSGWRAALAVPDRDAARQFARALHLRGFRAVRDDRGALGETEPLGPAASAVLCRVLYDSITASSAAAGGFVDAVLDRRVQAQRLRPVLSDAAYRVEVEECAEAARGATLLLPPLRRTLAVGLERCDAVDASAARVSSVGRAVLARAAAGEDPVRCEVDVNWLVTVFPLAGAKKGEPRAAAFLASPAALKAEALEPAARAPYLPDGLALVVRDAAERDVLAPADGRVLLSKPVGFGTAVPGIHANVALVDASFLAEETNSARNLWLAILIGAGLAVVAASLLAVRAVLREVRLARMKSDFVSNLSHELRTPLTSLRMFVETLREGRVRDEAEAKECLDIVAQETERLQGLVERMLQFASFTRGRAPIELKSADAGDVARRAFALFKKRAEAARASLELAVEDPLPESILDRDAVLQVLLNLLDNAVKYAGHDGAKIRVGVRAAGSSGAAAERVLIEVEDDGPGVPEKERELVFEEFYRGDDTLSRRVEGTGIGLAVARRIVLAHGGTIEARRSARLGGAHFLVTIPEAAVGRRLAIEAASGGAS